MSDTNPMTLGPGGLNYLDWREHIDDQLAIEELSPYVSYDEDGVPLKPWPETYIKDDNAREKALLAAERYNVKSGKALALTTVAARWPF